MALYEILEDGTPVKKAGIGVKGTSIKELWTNSSSSLGATTANLSSDEYDYLIIIHTEGSVMIKKGQSTTLNRTSIGYWNTANDTILQRTRSFTYVDDKTYNIGQGESRFWNGGIKGTNPYVRDGELVPYKILGVKL
jgi:hypothetical protein